MRTRIYRWLLPVGLATATLFGTVSSASAQPAVRDHRRMPPAANPDAPPPPQRTERTGAPRRGYVWVAGNWDWRNGRWQWTRGHYERQKAGKRWSQQTWDQRDGAWVRIGGSWDDAPQYPDQAPPDPRAESVRPRRGFVWVKGRWDWQNGTWQWSKGRYEREQVGQRWNDGRWDQRDGRWQWNDGGWQSGDAPSGRSNWSFDSRGWTLIGEKTVDGRVDQEQVDFSQKMGKVSKITIVVLDSDLEMLDLKVVYVTGKDFRPTDRQFFREGTRTRVINLDRDEILRAVQFKYANLPGGGKARVQVWGNVR